MAITYLRVLFLFSILTPTLHSLPHMYAAPETSPSFSIVIISPIPHDPCLLDEETDALTVDKGLSQLSRGLSPINKHMSGGCPQHTLGMLSTPRSLALPSLGFCSLLFGLEVLVPGRIGV